MTAQQRTRGLRVAGTVPVISTGASFVRRARLSVEQAAELGGESLEAIRGCCQSGAPNRAVRHGVVHGDDREDSRDDDEQQSMPDGQAHGHVRPVVDQQGDDASAAALALVRYRERTRWW